LSKIDLLIGIRSRVRKSFKHHKDSQIAFPGRISEIGLGSIVTAKRSDILFWQRNQIFGSYSTPLTYSERHSWRDETARCLHGVLLIERIDIPVAEVAEEGEVQGEEGEEIGMGQEAPI
jgi:hypothetical protein